MIKDVKHNSYCKKITKIIYLKIIKGWIMDQTGHKSFFFLNVSLKKDGFWWFWWFNVSKIIHGYLLILQARAT